MGRAQSFDTDEAVRAARTVFWERGYEDASLPALEHATGLSRSSIYHAFGSKRGLFDAAVRSYLDEVVRPRLRPLVSDPVGPDAIVDYLTGLRRALARRGTLAADHGCLVVNTAGAPIAHDPAVGRVIADYRRELEDAIARGLLARGIERGGLAAVVASLVMSAMMFARIDTDEALRLMDTAVALVSGPPALD